MVYLFKEGENVLFFADLSEAKRTHGLENPDKTITDKEFESADGLVRIIDDEIFIGKTDAEKLAEAQQEVREKRDKILSEVVDKMQGVLRWNSLSESEQTAWTEYRQALLDVPEQEIFSTDPSSVDWGTQPTL